MTASRRRTVIVSVAALVVAVTLVLAASTGPSDLVGEGPPETSGVEPVEDQESGPGQDPAERASEEQPAPTDATDLGEWLHEVLTFALMAAGLLVLVGLLRGLALWLARRLPDEQLVVHLEPPPDLEAGREALRGDQERHEAALAQPDVRNGIVACWVLLEEAAAASGVPRAPAETATEFVVRFLHALDVDPRPVAALAHLFHEARFSTHDLGPDARARAEAALWAVHADLDRSVAR